jgi:hypothetical protein
VDDETGDVVWDVYATVDDRRLVWRDPAQATPERIAEKLQRARLRRAARANVTQRRDLETMLTQARALLASQAASEALALLERAWAMAHDPRILGTAQQALARDNQRWARLHEETRQRHQAMEQILRVRQWDIVQQQLDAILHHLPTAAAYQPPGGWPTVQQRIDAGTAAERAVQQKLRQAQDALDSGDARNALAFVDQDHLNHLDYAPQVGAAIMRLRVAAAEQMYQDGLYQESSVAMLRSTLSGIEEQAAQIEAWRARQEGANGGTNGTA